MLIYDVAFQPILSPEQGRKTQSYYLVLSIIRFLLSPKIYEFIRLLTLSEMHSLHPGIYLRRILLAVSAVLAAARLVAAVALRVGVPAARTVHGDVDVARTASAGSATVVVVQVGGSSGCGQTATQDALVQGPGHALHHRTGRQLRRYVPRGQILRTGQRLAVVVVVAVGIVVIVVAGKSTTSAAATASAGRGGIVGVLAA